MPKSLLTSILFSKAAIGAEVIVALVFGVYIGKAVLEKRATEAQIARLAGEIEDLEHQKDSLGELIEYVQTDAFVRQEAREKLNVTAPGESVVVIPDIDEVIDDEEDSQGQGTVLGAGSAALWWQYFFDREALEDEELAE